MIGMTLFPTALGHDPLLAPRGGYETHRRPPRRMSLPQRPHTRPERKTKVLDVGRVVVALPR